MFATCWFEQPAGLAGDTSTADQLGQIESERKAIRLSGELRDEAVHGLDATALRKFSDDDVMAAMFASPAASF